MSLAIGALTLAPSNPEILYVGHRRAQRLRGQLLRRRPLPHRQRQHHRQPDRARSTRRSPPASRAPPRSPDARSARSWSTRRTPPPSSSRPSRAPSGNPSSGSLGFTVPPLAMRGVYRSTERRRPPARRSPKLTVTSAGSIPPDTTGDVTISRHRHRSGRPERDRGLGARLRRDGGIGRHLPHDQRARADSDVHAARRPRPRPPARGELTANRVGGVTSMWAATGESNGRAAALDRRRRHLVGVPGGRRELLQPAVLLRHRGRGASHGREHGPPRADRPRLIQARSTDGGGTFTTNVTTAAGLHVDTHVIVYAPSNPNIMYFGSDGGIWRSTDSGTTWTSRNNTQFTPPSSRASRCTRRTASS